MLSAAGAGVWFAELLVDWFLVGGLIGFAGVLFAVVACGLGGLVGLLGVVALVWVGLYAFGFAVVVNVV